MFFGDKIKNKKIKMLKSVMEWQNGKRNYPIAPVDMQFELSNVCNITCLMCGFFSPLVQKEKIKQFEDSGVMSYDSIDNFDEFLQKTLYVSLFGYGEPLVHPEFERILKKMGSYKLCTTFFTNAKKLDEKISQILVDNNLYKITISFSGARKEIYENIYLGSNFEDVISKIKYLNEYKKKKNKKYPIIELNTIGFKDHVLEFDKFVEIMASVGVNMINLMPLNDYLPDNTVLADNVCVVRPEIEGKILERAKLIAKEHNMQIYDNLSLRYTAHNSEEYEKLKNTLICAKNENTEKLNLTDAKSYCTQLLKECTHRDKKLYSIESFDKNDSVDKICEELNPIKLNTTFKCTQPHTMMYITQRGKIKPCCNAAFDIINGTCKMLGDINETSCEKIWNGNAYNVFRNVINEGKYPYAACKYCVETAAYPDEDTYICIIEIYADWYLNSFNDKTFKKLATKIRQNYSNKGGK